MNDRWQPDGSSAIKEGDAIAAQPLHAWREGAWHDVNSEQLFGGRRVIVFGLPGAFTPVCSGQHLPRYNEFATKFFALGVDEIVCVTVNDAHVVEAWGREQACDSVTLVADGNGDFSRSIGMLVDKRDVGYGMRSWRYSMLVNDGRVEKLFVEPRKDGDPFEVSDADTMLKSLDPEAVPPDEVVIFTKEGCPHCAHAKEMLEEAGFNYVEFPLEDNVRGLVVGALTGRRTVPQVFLNGELIGGEEDLEKRLYGASGPPETRPT
jgi:glutathione-dependent peroxiredoxin